VYFVLKNDNVKNNCIEKIKSLDGVWDVFIEEHGSLRSKAQNSLYWKWLTIIGNDIGYHKDDMHFVFGMMYLECEKRNIMGFERMVVPSTTSLSVKRFTDYLRQIEAFAVENGIRLPHPDFYDEAMS